MQALEMQFATLHIARTLASQPDVPSSVTDPIALTFLPRAQTFAWSSDMTKAAWLASKTIPEDARFSRDMLPDDHVACWWWFDWPLPIPMDQITTCDYGDLDTEHVHGLLLCQNRLSPLTICDCRLDQNRPFLTGISAISPPEASLAEMLRGERLNIYGETVSGHSKRSQALLRFVLAASVWIKQRILSMDSGPVERHRRKQLAREFNATVSDVKVVSLRRMESQYEQRPQNHIDIEWSCRWIVNGHWRNQYHPSTGRHELKYILPYVKGPEDKPLRVPGQTIYVVNR